MTDAPLSGPDPRRGLRWPGWDVWRNRLVASRGFQRWASRFPLTRRTARKEGEAMFDVIAGFVQSQVLFALVKLDVFETLKAGPATVQSLGLRHGIAADRMEVLLQAGAASGLLQRKRRGQFGLSRRGAALLGVPGLLTMIGHHDVLYRDLSDPVGFLQGRTEPELAGFWPYVFGPGAEIDPDRAAIYSDLMAESQALVAEETLRAVSFNGVRHLMDVGGGTGVFLSAVARANPAIQGTLFDLPEVVGGASARFAREGLDGRLETIAGSFRTDTLPTGADAISLVRVLYDHGDATVEALLGAVYAALPPGGRVLVSEPMSGGARPDRITDTYFAFYTLAMGTGRTRSPAQIADHLKHAGFSGVRQRTTHRPFVTSVVEAVRPT